MSLAALIVLFATWLQEFVSSLEMLQPVVIMLPEVVLGNVREVRLEIVKLSSQRSSTLRVNFLGCAEGNLD